MCMSNVKTGSRSKIRWEPMVYYRPQGSQAGYTKTLYSGNAGILYKFFHKCHTHTGFNDNESVPLLCRKCLRIIFEKEKTASDCLGWTVRKQRIQMTNRGKVFVQPWPSGHKSSCLITFFRGLTVSHSPLCLLALPYDTNLPCMWLW